MPGTNWSMGRVANRKPIYGVTPGDNAAPINGNAGCREAIQRIKVQTPLSLKRKALSLKGSRS